MKKNKKKFEFKSLLFLCKNMAWAIYVEILLIMDCLKPLQPVSIVCIWLELQGGEAFINQHYNPVNC